MTRSPGRHGLGDPRLPWNVLMRVALRAAVEPEAVAGRLAALAAEAGWPAPGPVGSAGPDVLARLATYDVPAEPVSVALEPAAIVLRAGHQHLDGLGLLHVAGRLTGLDLRSSARGVGRRETGGRVAGYARRLAELAVRPQATLAPSASREADGDVFAATTVPGEVGTAALVVATARTLAAHNERHAARGRRVTVAVGVSTVPGDRPALADHSGFLRLRDVERRSEDEVRTALRTAPLEHGGGTGGSALVRAAVRLLAGRLGSTVLVSHLGRVTGADEVEQVRFYPVTGGASGLSIGAATVGGRTTITARARAGRHDAEGLETLLEALRARLADVPDADRP